MDTVVDSSAAQAAGNPLKQLTALGQSPWLDFIRRGFIADGSLKKLVEEDGLGGVTSNPSIFEHAMGSGDDYDDEFKRLVADGAPDANTIYETLAVHDIQHAAEVLRPVFDRTDGLDGFVSLEVSPYLALRTEDTVTEARRLWAWVDRKNLMVKVPGTADGVPAVRTLIEEGININVTLLFSNDAYKAVAEAYVAGLEARVAKGEEIRHVNSVASFFVSRIDTAIDKAIDARLEKGGADADALRGLRGKVAIANAKLAYAWYEEFLASARWQALKAKGANPQRLLWASTGTKDKAYSDVLYVEALIGRDTVDTIPPATMDAFRDHGHARETLSQGLEEAKHVIAEATRLGLDLDGVTKTLVDDGVRLFADAADQLLGAVAKKRASLIGANLASVTATLPESLGKPVDEAVELWRREGRVRRLWAGDTSLWSGRDEDKWLAWLHVVDERRAHVDELKAFQREVQEGGFAHVLLLGMGGSSLGPEVLGQTFGTRAGYPSLHVLDSTDPQQIATFEHAVDLSKTLVIVSSKSGGTLEPNILQAYFFDRVSKAVGAEKAGSRFVAITDPGSHMQSIAEEKKFRWIFYGDKAIGGRYSVLSNFGLVPLAAIGVEVANFLDATLRMVHACSRLTPPAQNPGVRLGAILGEAQRQGRDKVTIVASPGIADLGAWLEQLLAESTGKIGRGIVPIDGETPAAPEAYGNDRLFAYLRLDDAPDAAQDAAMKRLADAGQPVVRVAMSGHMALGQQFFVWEFATAVAGSLIGIDAFDQPDVEASKVKTRELTSAVGDDNRLPGETPFATFDGVSLYADAKNAEALKGASLADVLRAQFNRAGDGDYIGLLAYIERNPAHIEWLQSLRLAVRDATKRATVAEFGPRFLHSTGQAYKGGPNSGVFVQITSDDADDLTIPDQKFSFSTVKAAQARGDFDVLVERGRRALRVHFASLTPGLKIFADAVHAALRA